VNGTGARPKIEKLATRAHLKASERYVDVIFRYPDEHYVEWHGSVPIEYRRTGINASTDDEINQILEIAYEAMRPSGAAAWLEEQDALWEDRRAEVTKEFFDVLKTCEWKCQQCGLPANPNWARRTQDIKELGYTLATDRRVCSRCGRATTHLILLRIPRSAVRGYESWSQQLRQKIVLLLNSYDVYEGAQRPHLLPDHKFPEIRWDDATRQDNLEGLSDAELVSRFQLLNNQRNEQKREVCRRCFQTRMRGRPFGIKFFYNGNERWPDRVALTGVEAEEGCVGCGWYDMVLWRTKLNEYVERTRRR